MAVNPADVRWAAEQVIRQHTERAERIDEGAIPFRVDGVPARAAGRCQHCGDEGCRMLTWAESEIAALRGVS